MFFSSPLGVVWDYFSSKLKGKQNKQNTSPKSYKTEIKFSLTLCYLNQALNNPAQKDFKRLNVYKGAKRKGALQVQFGTRFRLFELFEVV